MTSIISTDKVVTLAEQDTVHYFTLLPKTKKLNPKNEIFYYWFGGDRLKTTEGAYFGRLLNGEYVAMNRDKDPIQKGNFNSGIKVGKWLTWHPNGTIREVRNYEKGKEQGAFTSYFTNGALKETGDIKNGLKSGKWVTRNSLSNVILLEHWKKGKREGVFKEYYEDLSLKRRGKFKDDKLHGKLVIYAPSGEMATEKYKRGVLVPEKESKRGKNRKKEKDNSTIESELPNKTSNTELKEEKDKSKRRNTFGRKEKKSESSIKENSNNNGNIMSPQNKYEEQKDKPAKEKKAKRKRKYLLFGPEVESN